MIFGFREAPIVVDMALEATFESGKVVQAMIHVTHGDIVTRSLVYREGTTGTWLSSRGISFNGLPRNPETLVRVIGGADPINEIYTAPAI